jgi:hypothetical protein
MIYRTGTHRIPSRSSGEGGAGRHVRVGARRLLTWARLDLLGLPALQLQTPTPPLPLDTSTLQLRKRGICRAVLALEASFLACSAHDERLVRVGFSPCPPPFGHTHTRDTAASAARLARVMKYIVS